MFHSQWLSSWSARLLAGGMISAALMCAAVAQGIPPGCIMTTDPNSTAQGAALGGVAGALLGSAVSGRHNRGEGAVLGGLGGAVVGGVIGNGQGKGVACPEGYYYRPPTPGYYEEPPPAPAAYGDVWYGAPPRLHERIAFLRNEVARVDQDGWLSPRERGSLYHRLDLIQNEEQHLRYQTGGYLPPPDRARLFDELNDISRRIHWNDFTSHTQGY